MTPHNYSAAASVSIDSLAIRARIAIGDAPFGDERISATRRRAPVWSAEYPGEMNHLVELCRPWLRRAAGNATSLGRDERIP